ncbi:ER membrane protein (Pkr1) [Penicillium verhagenii]|uniref:ER membrane protein (Pkr1) n=1 Tax=Penicillium verhagenii TaxID=1562060 RepID=UPI002545273A|nr:ER membrane protein (Pkr1) [Penicillium verhagenii]KAJ5934789.1 ER membrane protein (Pkr1) [Penicillium verhagenii]
MASFVEELWSSVFTPGPTPTLLIATNASFAALQLVFFALLLATYSIHFVVLSFLSAGLWYSINWFAREVSAVQRAQEAEKKAQAEAETTGSERKKDSVDSADSETETESLAGQKPTAVTTGSAVSARLQPTEEDPKKRISAGGDSSGYGSTDSEWEKVEDN